MKSFKILYVVSSCSLLFLSSCSPEADIKNPDFSPLLFSEDFSKDAVDNTILDTQGWTNFAEVGTAKWREQIFSDNPYAEFSSFQSGNAINVAWLISPAVDMDAQAGETLVFQSSQSFVSSASNSLEVLISKDFDGTNVTTATWEPLSAVLPTTSSTYFAFINSGEIDLSGYTGKAYIGFRVKGSGTNTALDGSYQVDNIRVFSKK